MRKTMVIIGVCVLLLSAKSAQACVPELVNGSFEEDGLISNITLLEPNGWDVNIPSVKFSGYVDTEWVTDGSYNLTLYTQRGVDFEVNDMAILSQEICLKGLRDIRFDLKLDRYYVEPPWDPNCTAVLLIDENVVWESDIATTVYIDESYNVSDYKDENLHKLSLGIRVKADVTLGNYYKTHWDNIRLIAFPCDGNDYPVGDFDYDCYVDINDLQLFAEAWLLSLAPVNDPNTKYNLFLTEEEQPYGTINFFDFAIFASDWDSNIPDLGELTDVWLEEVDLNYEYNLYKDDDFEPNGIINFYDFAVFGENWMKSSFEQQP